MAFEDESVRNSITSVETEFPGPLFGIDDGESAIKGQNSDDRLATDIGSRHGKIKVLSIEQLWRDICELQVVAAVTDERCDGIPGSKGPKLD